MGPTLFLCYVNDVEHHLPDGVSIAVYADDTTNFCCMTSARDSFEEVEKLQRGVDALHRWGQAWKIPFEPSKSQACTFKNRNSRWAFPKIRFGGVDVEEVDPGRKQPRRHVVPRRPELLDHAVVRCARCAHAARHSAPSVPTRVVHGPRGEVARPIGGHAARGRGGHARRGGDHRDDRDEGDW